MSKSIKKPSFESKYEAIKAQVYKIEYKWNLLAVPHLEFNDFAMETIHHIYLKWKQYNPKYALEPWLGRIINNQFTNFLRDNYYRVQKPCIRCPLYCKETDFCSYSNGEPDTTCCHFAKWKSNKLDEATNIRLPVTIENHLQEVHNNFSDDFNYLDNKKRFEKVLLNNLTSQEKKIYKLLFIKHLSEKETAIKMGWKFEKNGRNKFIKNIEQSIIAKAKNLLKNQADIIDIW